MRTEVATGGKINSVLAFNETLKVDDREICNALQQIMNKQLPEAESKIWHAHPVWFLNGNPVVGYNKLKSCIRVLFWSGQSFNVPGLTATGTFKAAEIRYTSPTQVDEAALKRWIHDARVVQWDYKNLMKKGRLERLP